jgi:hypothetical protein
VPNTRFQAMIPLDSEVAYCLGIPQSFAIGDAPAKGGANRLAPPLAAIPSESKRVLISPNFGAAGRAMHAAQVEAGFGSSRSGRVKCCHEKRCLVTIVMPAFRTSQVRPRTACRIFDD